MMKAMLPLAALAASAAAAQVPPAPPGALADAQNAGLDPNQMICRSQSVIGSRLTRRRTCVTRAQWLAQNRSDRDLAEQAQTRRAWCGGGACPP